MSFIGLCIHGSVAIMALLCLRALCLNRIPKALLRLFWIVVLARVLLPIPPILTLHISRLFTSSMGTITSSGDRSLVVQPLAGSLTQQLDIWSGYFNSDVVTFVRLTVSLIMLSLLLASYARLLFLVKRSVPCDNIHVKAWLSANPLMRSIRVRESSSIHTPMTFGVVRPIILLPSGFPDAYGGATRLSLQHEFVHICRFDAPLKALFAMAVCLFWFNPLVWVMYRIASRDIELACDDAVMDHLDRRDRTRYLLLLINVVRSSQSLRHAHNHGGASFGAHEAFGERIRSGSLSVTNKTCSSVAASMLAAALLTVVCLGFVAVDTSAVMIMANDYMFKLDRNQVEPVELLFDDDSDVVFLSYTNNRSADVYAISSGIEQPDERYSLVSSRTTFAGNELCLWHSHLVTKTDGSIEAGTYRAESLASLVNAGNEVPSMCALAHTWNLGGSGWFISIS